MLLGREHSFGINAKGEEVYLSRAERFKIPNKIIIDEYHYTFKDTLKGEKFCYRCKSRRCGCSLIIDKEEMDKVNKGIGDLSYTLNKEHSCLRLIKKKSHIDNVLTERDLDDKPKNAVMQALDKPLNWHIQNLTDLGIKLSNKYIQNILFKERERKYLYEEEYLSDIGKIKIDLEYNSILNKNMAFCYLVNKMINPDKKKREERYVIFTCMSQLKHFIGSKEIYIDINYKTVPKGYQQLLTILSYNAEIKQSIPIFIIPMSFKSKLSYISIFESIFSILDDNDLTMDIKNLIFMCDCQKCLYDAIKEMFPDAVIHGNYYFYLKNLWIKAKRFGLCQRSVVESTKKMIFAMGLIPYLQKDEIKDFISEIKEYIKGLPDNYTEYYEKYLKFYEKSWVENRYYPMQEVINEKYNCRNNMLCEIFHKKLSYSFEYYFPKISSLAEKLKEIINYYCISGDEYGIKLDIGKLLIEDINIFVEEYKGNEKDKKIKFSGLLELENDMLAKTEKINISCLKFLFGLLTVEGIENEENILQNVYDYDEIEPIVLPKYSQPQPVSFNDLESKAPDENNSLDQMMEE